VLKAYFVDFSYDKEIGSNVVDAFVFVTYVSKNHSYNEIYVPNVEKYHPILDGYSDDEEHIFTKAHTELISIQPIYDSEEDKEFH
jgi:hypothetical protein